MLLKIKPEKSDAVIWLQGDRYDRGKKVLKIYNSGFAKKIVISGNNILIGPNARAGENNIGLMDMKKYLINNLVDRSNIIIDDGALNTKEQSIHITKLAKKNNWKKIILVSSAYHQPRVFLSFVKASQLISYKIKIVYQGFLTGKNNISSGRTSKNNALMKDESLKIKNYQAKGDIASYKEGFNYLRTLVTTKMKLKFRLVTIADANILLKWRNDPETRKSSHNSQKISKDEHIKWLKTSLKNSNRKIFIVEYKKHPVGTIRSDKKKDITELSWTVAPEARGRGIGKEMVAFFANQIIGPIRAEVKVNNEASKRIVEYAGMKFSYKENEILYYRRLAIDSSKNKLKHA